ncbi:hypothetical protein WICPIJ_003274 [Wickerhamomyces pijperi]|uniref:Uridine kinase n=1 Tax=Wickerhamomyces pijperi TaxID=599730 RepID=A0A9P8Q9W5_WICPI|nr:hypothetical protein WICPIJ_003274 [Wickerhamomyces pijperi]
MQHQFRSPFPKSSLVSELSSASTSSSSLISNSDVETTLIAANKTNATVPIAQHEQGQDQDPLHNIQQNRPRRRSSRIGPKNGSYYSASSSAPSLSATSLHLDSHAASHAANSEAVIERYTPPWTEPYIIGIAGPSGSGKTSIASKIIQEINTPWTVLLSLDNYYKPLLPEQRKLALTGDWNFDTPDAVDLELCYQTVLDLKEGRKGHVPVYSFTEHARTQDIITVYGANVIVIEGIHALHDEKLRSLMNLKVYVDTELDICLARRLSRDILSRGRDLAGALNQWGRFVKPDAERFVKPTMRSADLIVPRGSENVVAISLLIKHIKKQLIKKSERHLDMLDKLTDAVNGGMSVKLDPKNHPDQLVVLPESNQSKGIYTILLNKHSSRDDFIFYFDRIATTLVNKALESHEFKPVTIETPLNVQFRTVEPQDTPIAVSIIRSGDCFMHSLRKTLPEIAVGKLLIQSDSLTGEPQLHTESLPLSISAKNTKVLLLDAQIISGAAVIMAIQVLLDHGVREEDISVICYLANEIGLRRVLMAFKKVKIVVGVIGFRENINPDSGENAEVWFRSRFIDARYFGTS